MVEGRREVSVKERTRRTDADANRESDEVVVPGKLPNKGGSAPAEAVEDNSKALKTFRDQLVKGWIKDRTQPRRG